MSAGGFALQALRISSPYLFAALGGMWSERAGVINIALEGLLLAAALGATIGSLASGSAAVGVASGLGAAVALTLLYGVAVIPLRGNQIVCGVAVTLLAAGGTRFVLKLLYDSSSNSPRIAATGGAEVWLPALAFGLAVASHLALGRSRFGLRLRAAGEHPEALIAVGVGVARLRWAGLLLAALLTGLGGVQLAYAQHGFVANMSAGRGFIALAAMILGRWRPLGVLFTCVAFGAAEALQLTLQSAGLGLPAGLVQAIPYAVTIAALALRAHHTAAPRALGRPLD